ncbi:hypothetical protein EVAR_69429_1 [Eumeta japonica]|uniref:Uncharacterized protein n=1 Tax=Eumeta variegata TaxID=151549 RepID=A0A4C2A8L1_EUMVA|nr:hypothetical protein EVAR_69429_1 [Eumeta japonica]
MYTAGVIMRPVRHSRATSARAQRRGTRNAVGARTAAYTRLRIKIKSVRRERTSTHLLLSVNRRASGRTQPTDRRAHPAPRRAATALAGPEPFSLKRNATRDSDSYARSQYHTRKVLAF